MATVMVAAIGLGLPVAAPSLPQPEVAEPTSSLINGGFDAADVSGAPTDWAVSGTKASVVYRAADRTAGPGSLEIVDPASTAVSVTSRKVIGVEGSTYSLTGKAKVTSGSGARVIMRFYDFNKQVTGSKELRLQGSTFTSFSVTGKAPAGTDLVSIIIAGDQATTGTTYLDELELTSPGAVYDQKLGTGRELFLDDYRIQDAHDVTRTVHPGEKREAPVIRPDKQWEKSAYTYGSVYKIDGKYRLWYTCYNSVAPNYYTCYAESTNGTDWVKPELGLVSWNGSSKNNIVATGVATVAYNPSAPAEKRYAKLGFRAGKVEDGSQGYYAAFSADGLTWKDAQSKPVLLDGDVSNVSYDQRSGQYIASIKKRMFTADTSGYERSAFVATSKDFITWSRPQLAVMGDTADDGGAHAIGGLESQVYGMPVVPYENQYIGMPWMFDLLNFTSGEYATAADGPITPQIAASRDLKNWERPTREPLVEPGAAGAWDDGAMYTASNILVDQETVSLYYGGFNNGHGGAEASNPDRDRHQGQTGLATWRRDGFVSISNSAVPGTGGDAGEVTTKPLTFEGDTLHLNADVRDGGAIRVEILDANGAVIPGLTSQDITGDQLDASVQFDDPSAFGALEGTPVSIRFSVTNADLYSYWVS